MRKEILQMTTNPAKQHAQYPGKMPVETDEAEGRPSRWNTLRALRVLDWYSAREPR
jgi:hypothetical protein